MSSEAFKLFNLANGENVCESSNNYLHEKSHHNKGGKNIIICANDIYYANCVITRCAETGLVPPARGVMVSAMELPAGFRTVSIE
jgi:hypothetical protein